VCGLDAPGVVGCIVGDARSRRVNIPGTYAIAMSEQSVQVAIYGKDGRFRAIYVHAAFVG